MKKIILFISLSLSPVLLTHCMEVTQFEADKKYITEIKNESGAPATVLVYQDPMTTVLQIEPGSISETALAARQEGNLEVYFKEVGELHTEQLKQKGKKYNISAEGIVTKNGQTVDKIDVYEFSGVNKIEIALPTLGKSKIFEDKDFFKASRLIISKNGEITIEQIQ